MDRISCQVSRYFSGKVLIVSSAMAVIGDQTKHYLEK
jgi:hypothetical protein